MTFLYAPELKQIYDVYGHFYNLKIGNTVFKCRSILEITKQGKALDRTQAVDAVVIMMNPGSSKPADKAYIPKEFQLHDIFASGWTKDIIETKIYQKKTFSLIHSLRKVRKEFIKLGTEVALM